MQEEQKVCRRPAGKKFGSSVTGRINFCVRSPTTVPYGRPGSRALIARWRARVGQTQPMVSAQARAAAATQTHLSTACRKRHSVPDAADGGLRLERTQQEQHEAGTNSSGQEGTRYVPSATSRVCTFLSIHFSRLICLQGKLTVLENLKAG